MRQVGENALDRIMDFIYGYMLLKSYFFYLRFNGSYPNESYARMWSEYFESVNLEEKLDEAFRYVKVGRDGKLLDLIDAMDRASYYALIHPQHPNITLGFIKDADLWNLWLECGVYRYAREFVVDVVNISEGDKVVDFGCGSSSPRFYASIVGSSGFYVGIDYSKPLLKIAEKKCKSERLSDRVKLLHVSADAKVEVRRSYDIAILSSVIEYVSLGGVLRNAVEVLNGEGIIVVFSELFRDLEPEREKLFNLYYSLIPGFRRFPSVGEIQEFLDRNGIDYAIELFGKHVLVIQL